MNANKKHIHRAIEAKRITRGYTAPVAHPGNPRAHGGICHIDVCRCGATRRTNSTGGSRVERGPWEDAR